MNFYVKKEKVNIQVYPCIVLEPFDWDDYSKKTTFDFYLCHSQTNKDYIGQTKILSKQLNPTGDKDDWTLNYIPEEFQSLDDEFVSLFQDKKSYLKLKNICKEKNYNIEDMLNGIRDCGFNRSFLQGYKHRGINDSLLRYISAAESLNEGRVIILSQNKDEAFHFTFEFSPLYNKDQCIPIEFQLNKKNKYFPNRIFCIIGQNGSGKTQVINNLPGFIQNNPNNVFNKIIHITNSFFDRGVDVDKDIVPEYHYFGIVNKNRGTTYIQSKEQQINEIKGVINKIIVRFNKEFESEFIRDTFLYIRYLFPRIRFNEILDRLLWSNSQDENKQDFPQFIEDFSHLSSGESILLSNLIKMLSCITLNSLLLIDEPEIHLHPNFITTFMEFLYKILEKSDSYAIIATHSTYVVREVKANCVYIMNRSESNQCTIFPATRQTLGTNAMSLSIDIFQNDEIQPYFLKQIKEMVKSKLYSEEEIFNQLEIDNQHQLDLGVKMQLRAFIKEFKNA